MNCKKCPLNIDSPNFKPVMLKKVPLQLRSLFICNDGCSIESGNKSLFECSDLCGRDLWVLAFIGCNDRFAVEKAATTLNKLVAGGHSELLCNLFENASYEVRRDLWLRMTCNYPDRLYMFDTLFERESLAPLEPGQFPDEFHIYQHQMLFGRAASMTGIDDL